MLTLVALGLTNAQAAACLAVEPQTVKAHLSAIYARLGVRGRVEAAVWLWREGG